MTLWEIEYYTRPNGNQPVALWLEQLSIDYRKVVEAKIAALAQYGTRLLDTKVLKLIRGSDNDFYELRGGRCRVAIFHSGIARRFVLLHGFTKTRDNERREISRARDLLHEYLQIR